MAGEHSATAAAAEHCSSELTILQLVELLKQAVGVPEHFSMDKQPRRRRTTPIHFVCVTEVGVGLAERPSGDKVLFASVV